MSKLFRLTTLFVLLYIIYDVTCGNIPPVPTKAPVIVHKCCPEGQIVYESNCVNASKYNERTWEPVFTNEQGETNVQIGGHKFVIGVPECGSRQPFPIFHCKGSADILILLPDGRLRHYYLQTHHHSDCTDIQPIEISDFDLHSGPDLQKQKYYDYEKGLYCMDKAVVPTNKERKSNAVNIAEYAIVCNPYVPVSWYNTDFILRRVVDPACHGIALACYLAIAIIHFVMKQLRDLVGNILTTLTLSLAIAQIADTVRIFTEFTSPATFLIADCVLYISLLGAFFWLNSMGYYIWKMFRSRNVFLRITDGRKYCYYSFYVWGCTICMAALAVFAHFTLDQETTVRNKAPSPISQGALGWLGTAVFFTPIACTILMDIFFYVSTVKIIDRMSTYGRIHHKLKYSFKMYIQIFLIMTIGWIFMLLSWLPHNSMYYVYIVSNAIQAPLFLYTSVLSQKRVRFLIRKACCYDKCIIPCFRPDDQEGPEWGEEMMAMNR